MKIKKILALVVVIMALINLYNLLTYEEPTTFQLEKLSEELITENEIVVARGRVHYSHTITKNTWLPMDLTELHIDLTYEYYISYTLKTAEVDVINEMFYVFLDEGFNYHEPALISEDFVTVKKLLSTKFKDEIYANILKSSRQNILAELKAEDTTRYKLAVEKNINELAAKFGITNLKIVWER